MLGFTTRQSLDHVHLMSFLSLSQYKPEVASVIHQTPLDLTVVLQKLTNGLDLLNWEKTPKTATDEITIPMVNSPCRHLSTGPQ